MALKDGSPEDYQSAALRHFADAAALSKAGRLDNAGHLIGFSAECAIKHRIDTLGWGSSSPAQHLPELLAAARKRLVNRTTYASMYNLLKVNVFSDWSADQRYSATGKVTDEQIKDWTSVTQRLLAAANIRSRTF